MRVTDRLEAYPTGPTPASPQPPFQNHPRSPASSSAGPLAVNCQAKSKPRGRVLPTHLGIGCGSESWMSHHVLALGSKDLKRFVEDQSQLWENRATSNPTTMVMGYLGLRNAHSIHFPIDIVPAERQRFRGCAKPTVAAQSNNGAPDRVGLLHVLQGIIYGGLRSKVQDFPARAIEFARPSDTRYNQSGGRFI